MTERMFAIEPNEQITTIDEPWLYGEWYVLGANFAVDRLSNRIGKCLVIGSPIPEVHLLQDAGWETVYLDVRTPPDGVGEYVCGDATAIPFADNTFDAVSSTCVLCHAGLGRYGDPVKPNGDRLMMGEIARVLKPGGLAAIMAGPALPDTVLRKSVVYGNVHRIYLPSDVERMAIDAGLEMVDSQLFERSDWTDEADDEMVSITGECVKVQYCYLSVLLRKPE